MITNLNFSNQRYNSWCHTPAASHSFIHIHVTKYYTVIGPILCELLSVYSLQWVGEETKRGWTCILYAHVLVSSNVVGSTVAMATYQSYVLHCL